MADDATHDALTELITGFNDLNGPAIDEFNDEPSPLEFMRHVARNTPFVVRKGASSWKATREWCPAYLKQALGTQSVNVAVTPKG